MSWFIYEPCSRMGTCGRPSVTVQSCAHTECAEAQGEGFLPGVNTHSLNTYMQPPPHAHMHTLMHAHTHTHPSVLKVVGKHQSFPLSRAMGFAQCRLMNPNDLPFIIYQKKHKDWIQISYQFCNKGDQNSLKLIWKHFLKNVMYPASERGGGCQFIANMY